MFSPSGGGLDVLDLKGGAILTTLIPKLAEGMFHVIAKFNETNEYVLYYHSGHQTLKVFRMEDDHEESVESGKVRSGHSVQSVSH